MTVAIPKPRTGADDELVDVTPCGGCLDLLEPDELTDCGTHTLCAGCLASAPCSACRAIRDDIDTDRADQAAHDARRDRQTTEEDQ